MAIKEGALQHTPVLPSVTPLANGTAPEDYPFMRKFRELDTVMRGGVCEYAGVMRGIWPRGEEFVGFFEKKAQQVLWQHHRG